MSYEDKINKNTSGITFTDELHANVGATSNQLNHDYFIGGGDLTIRTAAAGGGTLLVEGAGNDYVLEEEKTDLSAEVTVALGSSKNVYKKYKIVNATYQTGNLYFSGKYIADDNSWIDVNYKRRHTKSLALTDDDTISATSTEWYDLYTCTTGAQLLRVNLPSAADAEDQVFKIVKPDTGYGCVRITPDGSDVIVASSGAQLDYLFLFEPGDSAELMSDGTNYYITNNFKPYFNSGWINRSGWSNVHLGFTQITYSGASGTFEVGEVITESTSANTWIIIHDSGTVFTCVKATGTGVATNTRTLTGGTTTETATVNGDTINNNSEIRHGFGLGMRYLRPKLYFSVDATENNSIGTGDTSLIASGSNDFGYGTYQTSSDSYYIQTASSGVAYISDTGGIIAIDTENWYYNINIKIE